jgi:hypothetical protein
MVRADFDRQQPGGGAALNGSNVDLQVHVANTAYTPFQLIACKNSMCLKEAA